MNYHLLFLIIQTLIFWILAFVLHRFKNRITLIPLYAYLAVLTILTHNFADLSFAIVSGDWFFLISSFVYFTSLMLVILWLYIFEGPRAARQGLYTVWGVSIIYIVSVIFLNLEVVQSNWIVFTFERLKYYIWSLLAVTVDVIAIAVLWELFTKLRIIPLVIRLFLISFIVYSIDAVIFVTGVFGGSANYLSILQSDLTLRFFLGIFIALTMRFFIGIEGFDEEKREKSKSLWEIVNLKSDLEQRIGVLESDIKTNEMLVKQLKESQDLYNMILSGSSAGVIDWLVRENIEKWSAKFYDLLGYMNSEIESSQDNFIKLVHPDDLSELTNKLNELMKNGTLFRDEFRLKAKDGNYKWFLCTAVAKFDESKNPVRLIGSFVDINDAKVATAELQKKIEEATKVNKYMIGRELAMVDLKKKLQEVDK